MRVDPACSGCKWLAAALIIGCFCWFLVGSWSVFVYFCLVFGRRIFTRARPRFVSGHIRCLGRAAEFCCPWWCPGQSYQVLVVAVDFRGDLVGWVVERPIGSLVGRLGGGLIVAIVVLIVVVIVGVVVSELYPANGPAINGEPRMANFQRFQEQR